MQVTMKSPNLESTSYVDQRKISPVININSRGKRFLDLVKNNKLNVSPQLTKRISLKNNLAMGLMERSVKREETSDDYLKFSNTLPNPNASPSSILSKRKAAETPDSPMNNSAKVL